MALKDWKKNKKTNFLHRWDKGTTEIHIQRVAQMSHPTRGKTSFRYFVEYSHSVGGFHTISTEKTEKDAKAVARRWMKRN